MLLHVQGGFLPFWWSERQDIDNVFVSGTQSACMKWRRMDSSRFEYLWSINNQAKNSSKILWHVLDRHCLPPFNIRDGDVLLSTTPSTIHLSVG